MEVETSRKGLIVGLWRRLKGQGTRKSAEAEVSAPVLSDRALANRGSGRPSLRIETNIIQQDFVERNPVRPDMGEKSHGVTTPRSAKAAHSVSAVGFPESSLIT